MNIYTNKEKEDAPLIWILCINHPLWIFCIIWIILLKA